MNLTKKIRKKITITRQKMEILYSDFPLSIYSLESYN